MIIVVIILIVALLGYVYLSARFEEFTSGAIPDNYNKRLTSTPLGIDDNSSILGTGTESTSAAAPSTGVSSAATSTLSSVLGSISGGTSSSNTQSSTPSSGDTTTTWQQNILNYHNDIRQQCSSDNATLTWDQDLADYAQKYADKVAAAKYYGHNYNGHNSYTYSGYPDGAGENLWYNEGGIASMSDDQAARAAVNGWAGEGYGADASPDADETGHYTAMNWRTATKLGCGFARNDNGWGVVSCNYADNAANFCCTRDQYQSLDSLPGVNDYLVTKGNTTSFDATGYNVQCTKPLSITI